VSSVRRRIATIVEEHLDEILDRTMDAFDAELPSVANATQAERHGVRESVRRAVLAFLTLYAEPESSAREQLARARVATVDRAGESFDLEDIVAMLRLSKHVVFQTARALVDAELGDAPERDNEVRKALEAFLDELAQTAELPLPRADAVTSMLASFEDEDPDFA